MVQPCLVLMVLPAVSTRYAPPEKAVIQNKHNCVLILIHCQVQEGQWGHLVAQGSKQELQERRQEAQQRLQLRLESHKQAQLDQRKALDK